MDPVHGGGPWTRSIEEVHGPGPDKGSMDRGSMFCTFPIFTVTQFINMQNYTWYLHKFGI